MNSFLLHGVTLTDSDSIIFQCIVINRYAKRCAAFILPAVTPANCA